MRLQRHNPRRGDWDVLVDGAKMTALISTTERNILMVEFSGENRTNGKEVRYRIRVTRADIERILRVFNNE